MPIFIILFLFYKPQRNDRCNRNEKFFSDPLIVGVKGIKYLNNIHEKYYLQLGSRGYKQVYDILPLDDQTKQIIYFGAGFKNYITQSSLFSNDRNQQESIYVIVETTIEIIVQRYEKYFKEMLEYNLHIQKCQQKYFDQHERYSIKKKLKSMRQLETQQQNVINSNVSIDLNTNTHYNIPKDQTINKHEIEMNNKVEDDQNNSNDNEEYENNNDNNDQDDNKQNNNNNENKNNYNNYNYNNNVNDGNKSIDDVKDNNNLIEIENDNNNEKNLIENNQEQCVRNFHSISQLMFRPQDSIYTKLQNGEFAQSQTKIQESVLNKSRLKQNTERSEIYHDKNSIYQSLIVNSIDRDTQSVIQKRIQQISIETSMREEEQPLKMSNALNNKQLQRNPQVLKIRSLNRKLVRIQLVHRSNNKIDVVQGNGESMQTINVQNVQEQQKYNGRLQQINNKPLPQMHMKDLAEQYTINGIQIQNSGKKRFEGQEVIKQQYGQNIFRVKKGSHSVSNGVSENLVTDSIKKINKKFC